MIYTLNLSDNLASRLTDYILAHISDPMQIAQTRVILPTKRACRNVKEAFVRKSEHTPLLLPQLTALYEMEDLSVALPEAISSAERLFLLARLCSAKPNIDTFDKAIKIAVGLAQILDEFYLYEASLDKLEEIVPNRELAIHWNESLTFLEIIRKEWPKILKERGKIDVADRRIRLINQLTQKVSANTFQSPIILAGFDGALPAVNRLIKALSSKNNALIFLDGLNNKLTDEDWENIHANHYQQAFKNLLRALDISATKIPLLSTETTPQEALIHEALKPAEQTEEWRHTNLTQDVLTNVHRIDCENPDEEALAIATVMREVLETPEKTAALVTTDRNLARRVILNMKRWQIELDDSAGTPLHHTEIGIYLSLLADYAFHPDDGKRMLALLKHPLTADGLFPAQLRQQIRHAEKEARQSGKHLDYRLQTDITAFCKLFADNQPVLFNEILTSHLALAEALATSSDRSGITRLWESDPGSEAYRFFAELKEYAPIMGNILPENYPETLNLLMSMVSIRPRYGMHPRLDILGPIEARFSHPDVCIIAGLNEGSFPTQPDTGSWLSRQMRISAGLPSLETEIGTQSMDFAHCFCAKEVYLTRSLKSDGSQTIPSRFISRLEAVLSGAEIVWKAEKPLIARALDYPSVFEKIERPAPVPPKELRPKKLSVTNIERLMRNPYGVYARYILKLYPLPELEKFNEGNMYGTAIHSALEEMVKNNNFNFDSNKLVNTMQEKLKELNMSDSALALYRPKLEKAAEFIMREQRERAPLIHKSYVEIKGEIQFPLCDGTLFTLTAEADRIDVFNENSIDIIDYKTGKSPKFTDIELGYSPQLPLEGVIAYEGGFKGVPTKTDELTLHFWRITGKDEGGTISSTLSSRSKYTYETLLASSYDGLKRVLNAYQNSEMPYEAYPVPKMVEQKYDDYAQLARVKEWLAEEDEEEATEA